jgi:hypothetical protein
VCKYIIIYVHVIVVLVNIYLQVNVCLCTILLKRLRLYRNQARVAGKAELYLCVISYSTCPSTVEVYFLEKGTCLTVVKSFI